ncbi:MAG: TetR/AcrR family transcriptional regulator, transcriptional repressor for nem operon [Streptosporangiaceae bacterium]|nr:TetR family transcriptional regulator [Streptosporangiaceae bacterium]MDQ1517985.1 TetR/AcrR family transcriptional regulator, transcriptional repressor for nem operon [Actinomycetota bacterium]MDX6432930.1 TetR/AcrR family transcriptional regulator, transcriptional repressor for nem operon [Streptosporangiaceae bacterium]
MARQSMREEIVEAALEQFHTHGFNAAGVKDITDAAGVPKGSFYNHFDSKEALAVVALQRYGAGRRLQDLADDGVEPLARLRAHFEFLRDEIVHREFTAGCLIGNFGTEIIDHSEVLRAAVRQSLQHWAALVAAALTEAQQARTVRAGLDPDTTARFILNAWEGTLIGARADRSADDFDAFFDIVFGTLLT